MFIGGQINVAGTSSFNGNVTANANISASGVITCSNLTNSTSTTTGSITTLGGLGVDKNANIGGNLGVLGSTSITGSLQVNSNVSFNSTTESTGTGNGALIVNGGAAIGKNVNVGGNSIVTGDCTITGSLFVQGERNISNTIITTTADNVLLINSAPAGTANSGIAIKRYQTANDSGSGDIISNDTGDETGTVRSSNSPTTIELLNASSTVTDHYKGYWVYLNAGTGLGQVRKIKSYNGSTKVATIYATADQDPKISPIEGLDFAITPSTDTTYILYSGAFIVTVFNESRKEYHLGGSPFNPELPAVFPITTPVAVHTGSLKN